MPSKEDMRNIEMSYPLKINLILRGRMMFPCPDCKTPHDEKTFDCDRWCLSNCSFSVDRELLSERQLNIHNESRKTQVQSVIEALSGLCEQRNLSDDEFFMKAEETIQKMKK